MIHHSDSEPEFWNDLEQGPAIFNHNKQKKKIEEKIKKYKETVKNPLYQEKLQKLVQQARNAMKETYQNKLKLNLHKQAKEYQSRVEQIQKQHRDEIDELVKKFWKLDDALIARDVTIKDLQKYFITQEEEISFKRMRRKVPIVLEQKEESGSFKDEVIVIKQQMETFRELVGIYENDIDKLKKQIKDLEQANLQNLQLFQAKKSAFKAKTMKIKEDCAKKIKQAEQNTTNFKNAISAELELKEVISSRQQEVISTLKTQLTCAKTVLDTPRLLYKYNARQPYRYNLNKSLHSPPLTKRFPDRKISKHSKFNSNNTLISTRATPVFTLTPDLDYPSSILPTLSESEYYR